MKTVPSPSGRKASSAGFSLIEVVMAIGIVAFAYIALFGLLPSGMSMFSKATDNSIGSQILQRVVGDAQQADFTALVNGGGGLEKRQPGYRYFDYQGIEVPSMHGSIYTAEVTVVPTTELPNASTPPSTNLATVRVRLANNPNENPAPFEPSLKLRIRTHTALVARK